MPHTVTQNYHDSWPQSLPGCYDTKSHSSYYVLQYNLYQKLDPGIITEQFQGSLNGRGAKISHS